MPSLEEIFADPDKMGKIAAIEGQVQALLANNPPDPNKFRGNYLLQYFLDDPDPGSIETSCEVCGSKGMSGPKSMKLKRQRPMAFRIVCSICGFALVKLRSEQGEEIDLERNHVSHWID